MAALGNSDRTLKGPVLGRFAADQIATETNGGFPSHLRTFGRGSMMPPMGPIEKNDLIDALRTRHKDTAERLKRRETMAIVRKYELGKPRSNASAVFDLEPETI